MTFFTRNSKLRFGALLCSILFIGISATSVSAQFKELTNEPTNQGNIEFKPLYTPGQQELAPEKQIPLLLNTMDRADLENRVTRIMPKAFDDSGSPIFFKGSLLSQKSVSVRNQVDIYMHEINRYYKLKNILNEFQIVETKVDKYGIIHIAIQQIYNGIPVEGGEMKLHAKDGIIHAANGTMKSTPAISTDANITLESAFEIVQQEFIDQGIYQRVVEEKSFLLPQAQFTGELVISSNADENRLVYKVDAFANLMKRYIYFIDAKTGEIVKNYKNYCSLHGTAGHSHEDHISGKAEVVLPPDGPATANALDLSNTSRTLNTYEQSGSFYLIDASRASMYNASGSVMPDEPLGVIWTIDAFNTNPENSNFEYDHVKSGSNSWSSKTAVSAHYNGGVAYEYFKNVHSRNSINDKGGNIVSLINISDPSGGGFDNAFWNGAAMFYGNGNTAFTPLAGSVDVAGHEMSHGVVQTTANLTYQGESGALNESFADIFGAMMDKEDWFLGEDVVKTSVFPTGKLRDMSNPHNGGSQLGDNGWQPDHTNEQYNGSADNGGVHINSGIVNHAYYKFAISAGVGTDKAEKIYYQALTNYLTASSKFIDLRASVEQSCDDLGFGGTVKDAASAAFASVGIGAGGNAGGGYEEDVDNNPGDDFLLHADGFMSNLILRGNDLGIIADPLSEVDMISKASVTDNGNDIFFVGTDNNIYNVTIDWVGGTFGINVFDQQGVWRNVAISKDGKRIAALTTNNDNEIIVLDFITGQQESFTLYNPTFTEGVSTGDVDFADAMEFDFTGEWLMYDAQSTINGASGSISYWDIGFLNVFNNSSNNFANGTVQKLFSQLPEKTSVGNPTFSKNSPYIVAFDLIADGSYAVMGANIEDYQTVEIFENGGLGYPSFNNFDNQIVYEFASFFGTDIGISELDDTKITPVFNSEGIIVEDAKRPVVFSNGERDIVSLDDLENTVEFSMYPNPVSTDLVIEFPELAERSVQIFDVRGVLVYTKSLQSKLISVDTRNWIGGVYSVQIQEGKKISISKVVKK